MLQALLAAADPLDRMCDPRTTADVYEVLAVHVLSALRSGADARRLIMLLSEHAGGDGRRETVTLATVAAFAEAATDWWSQAASRWIDPVAI